ncbi:MULTISPECIES: hypothetical protein [Curtobacterium]|uniref:hypothetical protein n=1 Tax=Curtobacterium flaccumfaciens TaxID=2035 RepID=UPI003EE43523
MATMTLPDAVLIAQDMIWERAGRGVPAHRLHFELTTEPDQYRLSWISPDDGFRYRALVPRITLTPQQFDAWQTWLDSNQGDNP